MKLRITAYAVDAFRFACIMSFINVLLSRFGIYGTADKLIFNEYGLSPWIRKSAISHYVSSCCGQP